MGSTPVWGGGSTPVGGGGSTPVWGGGALPLHSQIIIIGDFLQSVSEIKLTNALDEMGIIKRKNLLRGVLDQCQFFFIVQRQQIFH